MFKPLILENHPGKIPRSQSEMGHLGEKTTVYIYIYIYIYICMYVYIYICMYVCR